MGEREVGGGGDVNCSLVEVTGGVEGGDDEDGDINVPVPVVVVTGLDEGSGCEDEGGVDAGFDDGGTTQTPLDKIKSGAQTTGKEAATFDGGDGDGDGDGDVVD